MPTCPECGTPLIIDEWDGWRWVCFNCDHVGRVATDDEIVEQEREMTKLSDEDLETLPI